MLRFVNTMVYVTNSSWHISYAMKLWIKYVNEVFDGDLVRNHKRWGLDYMNVGKNHVDGGRQGGTFMDPWDGGEMSPKVWSIIVWDSFGSVVWLSGCFGSWGLTLLQECELVVYLFIFISVTPTMEITISIMNL